MFFVECDADSVSVQSRRQLRRCNVHPRSSQLVLRQVYDRAANTNDVEPDGVGIEIGMNQQTAVAGQPVSDAKNVLRHSVNFCSRAVWLSGRVSACGS